MDIRSVDLNLLVVFEALLRAQSVSRAAEALGMSQPATSFALTRLRRVFEDPLFVRGSHGITPTPRAEQLTTPLRAVLDQIRADLFTHPTFDPAHSKRVVTLNMSDIGELVFLPRILKHLLEAAPGIDLKTVTLHAHELNAALASGGVDLAVGYFPELTGADVFQQRLFSHSFVCVVRKDHPAIGDEITRKQFLDAKHAIVHPEGQSIELFEAMLKKQGLSRRVVLRVKHYLAIPTILSEFDLVFTVPYAIGAGLAQMANVKMLRPPFAAPRADVKQHWHARFQHDPANRWIRGVVAELFLEQRRRSQRQPSRRPRDRAT